MPHQDHSQAYRATRRSTATTSHGNSLEVHGFQEATGEATGPSAKPASTAQVEEGSKEAFLGETSDRDFLSRDAGRATPQCSAAKVSQVSQGRRDALNGRWVIFAPGRSERPAEILEAELPTPLAHTCPFCAGNEAHTPPPTLSMRSFDDDQFDWSVRVVPNLFPAVSSQKHSPYEPSSMADVMDEFNSHLHWHNAHWEEPHSVLYHLLHPQRNNVHFGGASAEHLGRGPQVRSCADDHSESGPSQHREDVLPVPGVADPTGAWTTFVDAQPEAVSLNGKQPQLFEYCQLHGGHEVIVETPHHVESLTSLSDAHVAQVFEAYAERIRYWLAEPGVRYVVVFKNAGAAAGASLRHTHSQLIATSLLPPAMEEVGGRMLQHRAATGKCLLCDMLAGELAERSRIITETERFVVYCPFASRLPYLVRIAPKRHAASFEQSDAESIKELAKLTQQVLRSLESMFVACAYNYTIHTCPAGFGEEHAFHWWMEIFPRLTKVAGFEWGSDCYINPVTPEMAAEHFRGGPH